MARVPAVPELGWVSSNTFFNSLKGFTQNLNFSLFDNEVEKLSQQYDAVFKPKSK